MSYLIDTNTCVYAMNRDLEVLKILGRHRSRGVSVSSITVAELEFGIYNSAKIDRNRFALTQFLAQVTPLEFGALEARHFGIIQADLRRRGCLLSVMDMLIAAHARALGLTLVTNDKAFSRIEGLKTVNWIRKT